MGRKGKINLKNELAKALYIKKKSLVFKKKAKEIVYNNTWNILM